MSNPTPNISPRNGYILLEHLDPTGALISTVDGDIRPDAKIRIAAIDPELEGKYVVGDFIVGFPSSGNILPLAGFKNFGLTHHSSIVAIDNR